MVEHVHGKDGVAGSIPAIGSNFGTSLRQTVVHARLYDRSTRWQWFILEMDGDDDCFGIVLSRALYAAA